MYRKKKKKAWVWILIGLTVLLAAGGWGYYRQVQAASSDEEEEIVLEEDQEWKYFKITQILGNEMTATVIQENGEETTESGTWMIPVGTEVVTKLGTTTTFARLASGDTIKVLMQNEDDGTQDILKIWIVDLTQTSNGAPDMQGTPGEDGEVPDMGEMPAGDAPDIGEMSTADGAMPDMGTDGNMPNVGEMPSDSDSMPSMNSTGGGMPGGDN